MPCSRRRSRCRPWERPGVRPVGDDVAAGRGCVQCDADRPEQQQHLDSRSEPGDDGSVSQSNTAASSASAGNQAATTQNANQTGAGSGIQTAQQQAGTDQVALALSEAAQLGASNVNAPVRVLSPGDDGSVTQGNSVGSQATSGNTAATGQTSTQGQSSACSCSGSGSGVQTATQSAGTGQTSGAASTATQDHPSNTNVSIRVLSPGGDGSVSQANTVGSQATSGNAATTGQTATQNQGSPSCGCSGSGSGIQSANQSAGTEQESGALSTATQDHPSNTNVSIRVLSPGDDGSVSQANTAGSTATSGNSASTTQNATQTQARQRQWLRLQHRSGAAGARRPAGRRTERRLVGRREPVECCRFVGKRRQPRLDRPERLAEHLGHGDPDRRSVRRHGSVLGGAVEREADRSFEHGRLDPGAQPR